jgi:hypothetical protein
MYECVREREREEERERKSERKMEGSIREGRRMKSLGLWVCVGPSLYSPAGQATTCSLSTNPDQHNTVN